jgi:hypothetical protein
MDAAKIAEVLDAPERRPSRFTFLRAVAEELLVLIALAAILGVPSATAAMRYAQAQASSCCEAVPPPAATVAVEGR